MQFLLINFLALIRYERDICLSVMVVDCDHMVRYKVEIGTRSDQYLGYLMLKLTWALIFKGS